MGINKLVSKIMTVLDQIENQNGMIRSTFADLKAEGVNIVGIDAKLYLYQCLGNEKKLLINLIMMIQRIVENGILPLFIFDGKFTENTEESMSYKLRKKLLEKRRKMKSSNKSDLSILHRVQELKKRNPEITENDFRNELVGMLSEYERSILSERRLKELYEMEDDKVCEKMKTHEKSSWNVNSKHIKICCAILRLFDIPYIFSDAEADPLLANLCKMNIIQAVISEDTDMLAYGTPLIIRDFKFKSNEITVCRMSNILTYLDITYDQFIDWCILLGTDYNHCVKNLDSERTFLERLKEDGNIESIFQDFFEKTGKMIINCIPYMEIHQIFKQDISETEIAVIRNLLGYSRLDYQIEKKKEMLLHVPQTIIDGFIDETH